jgi:hypothetical protein
MERRGDGKAVHQVSLGVRNRNPSCPGVDEKIYWLTGQRTGWWQAAEPQDWVSLSPLFACLEAALVRVLLV